MGCGNYNTWYIRSISIFSKADGHHEKATAGHKNCLDLNKTNIAEIVVLR